MPACPPPPGLLVVPGLGDSGADHWQSWLQRQHRHSLRVVQDDWQTPDLARWAAQIGHTLAQARPGPWLAVAHSFGVLALVQHLADTLPASRGLGAGLRGAAAPHPVVAALLVAPADPRKFGLDDQMPRRPLGLSSLVVASQTDPWMAVDEAALWAARWDSHFVNLGDAGHINAASGHGPLPLARRWLMAMHLRAARGRHGRHSRHSGDGREDHDLDERLSPPAPAARVA